MQHYSICANFGVVSNRYATNYFCSGAYQHMIANDRTGGERELHIGLFSPQGNALHDSDLFTNALSSDDRSHSMRQKQSSSNLYFRRNFDPKEQNIEHGEKLGQQPKAVSIKKS